MAYNRWKPAPLSSSFMLTAILAFIISAFWVLPQNETWGITFLIFFTIMFIASVLSMTHAPVEELCAVERKAKSKRKATRGTRQTKRKTRGKQIKRSRRRKKKR